MRKIILWFHRILCLLGLEPSVNAGGDYER